MITSHWADRPLGRLLLWSVVPALVLLAWWMGIQSGSAVVPGFGDVIDVLVHPFDEPEGLYSRSFAFSIMMTLIRLSLGFGLGAASGIALGLLAGQSRVADRILEPLVHMARPINPIVLLPIATVIFGIMSIGTIIAGADAWKYDILDQVQVAMVLILWWGAFFPIFMSTLQGVRAVRTSYLETMTLMGATRWQVFKHVLVPHSLPYAAGGMRIAMGVTWLVLIAAEIFPGTRSGLGYLLCVACKTSDYQYTFAALIAVGVIAFATDLAMQRMEAALGHWQQTQR